MAKIVLVVDDYLDTRKFMRFLIEVHGHQVIEATNGLEAVESVRKEAPDMIFMDMSMPEMDGLTATRIIREMEGADKIPIIAFTAYGKQMKDAALKAGCDELLVKPLEPEILDPVLEKYLENQAL